MASRSRLSSEDVLDAAATLADAEGLDDFTLTRLAEELDVAPSALYNHIDSADALVNDISTQATTELLEVVTGAAVGRIGGKALRELASAYRQYAEDFPGRYGATLIPTLPDDDERWNLDRQITSVIARVVESFGVDEDDAYNDARSLRSAIHGFVSLEATAGFPSTDELDKSFRRLIDLLVVGLEQS